MKKRRELKKDRFSKNQKGQVWVETVVYLLIAFVMMGLVLSFTRPKIEEMRDKAIIEQSIQVIKEIDNSIITIGSTGNKRLIEIGVKKGFFTIDSESDCILFEMNTEYIYGEIGEEIYIGNVKVITEGQGKARTVTLNRSFSKEYDIIYNNQDTSKILTKAPTPYKLFIENKGVQPISNKIVIDFTTE